MEKQERSKMLGTMHMGRLVPKVSIPIMISMLVQALYNVVDGIFVARYSADAFTAVSLVFPIQMLMIAVGTGLGVGINSLVSRRLGEGRAEAARDAARNGIFLELCGGLLFCLFGILGARSFMHVFTEDQHLQALGGQYLTIVTVFSFGLLLSMVFERLMQSTGNTTLSMTTQLAGAVTNIILDPIMIFTLDMGVAGAAWATVIGQWVSMSLGLFLNQTRNRELKVSLRGFRPDGATIKEILAVGFPSIIMQAISSVMNVGMNMILLGFGNTAVNVLGVYFKLQSFIFMPVFGLGNGLVAIVGYNYGARQRERVYAAIKVALTIALGIMGVGLLLFMTVPQVLLSLFESGDAGDLRVMGQAALRTISLSFLMAAVGIIVTVVFQAVGKGVYSLIMSLCRQLIVLLPVAYLLSRTGSVSAVWWAFPIAELVSLTICLLLFRKVDREMLKKL
ncbi:MAG: MATE family efflux transporter [Clostridia bacterium]|nr:MATE family efflux transporter [Clostridia bacterium]